MLADTKSQLIDYELKESNTSEKEGHKYGYFVLESLPDLYIYIYIRTDRCTAVITANIDTKENIMVDQDKVKTRHNSLIIQHNKPTEMQVEDIFCITVIKLICDKNKNSHIST